MDRGNLPQVAAVALSLSLVLGFLAAPAPVARAETDQRAPAQIATPTQENNTSVQHRNPEDVDRRSDLQMVQSWLEGRMGSVLVDCTDGLAIGSYEVCDRLDGQYPDWLGKYVDLAEETDGEADDRAGPEFQETKDNLGSFANQTRHFRTTYEQYREARRQGNETRARRLARDLVETAQDVNETATPLSESFRELSNTTDLSLRPQATRVDTIRTNVTTIAAQVETQEFAPTSLEVSIRSTEFSYVRPLEVTGQLRSEGEPLADGQIVLQAGEQRIQTRTDESGTFAFDYRPTSLGLEVDSVTIRYVPDPDSTYRSAETTRPVEVTQVTPTLEVDVAPEEARFDERVTTQGRLAVEGEPVSGVPIVVVANGYRIDRQPTNATGQYAIPFRVPATIPAGSGEVLASVPYEDRALAGVNASESIEIQPTPTNLTIAASETAGDRISVRGTLATQSGTPVEGQPVSLRVNGTDVATVNTAASGEFERTVSVPPDLADGDRNVTLAVAAAFSGSGTNLESSRVRTTIRMSLSPAGGDGQVESALGAIQNRGRSVLQSIGAGGLLANLAWWHWTLGIAALIALLGAGFVLRERLAEAVSGLISEGRVSSEHADAEGDVEPARTDEDGTEEATQPDEVSPLDLARTHLDSGDANEAMLTAYAAVRDELRESARDDRGLTHWEFLTACQENGLAEESLDALQQVTEAYEQAAFAPETIDRDSASAALDAAEELV